MELSGYLLLWILGKQLFLEVLGLGIAIELL